MVVRHHSEGRALRSLRFTFFSAVAALIVFFTLALHAQQGRHRKVPGLNKITSGATHQAFSGKVQSLDLKDQVLSVNSAEDPNTEIFPIRKGTHVTGPNGSKLKLAVLTPGTSVLVYYDQRGEHRTVKQIVVLTSSSIRAKKKS